MSGNAISGYSENEMKHVESFERHIQLLNVKSSGKHVKISVVAYTWEMSSEGNRELINVLGNWIFYGSNVIKYGSNELTI
jgi:hypothetical protein